MLALCAILPGVSGKVGLMSGIAGAVPDSNKDLQLDAPLPRLAVVEGMRTPKRRPLIGLPARAEERAPGHYNEIAYLGQAPIVDSIHACGGDVIVLTHTTEPAAIDRYARICDGFLIPGGADVDAARYGQESLPTTSVDPLVDQDGLEFALVARALEAGKPLLGICRGSQVINVALGGTLWQDIPSQLQAAQPPETRVTHMLRVPERTAHTVRVQPGSLLADIVAPQDSDDVDLDAIPVSSSHHQCVHDLAPGLAACAWAADGVIEAFEPAAGSSLARRGLFVLGVQWHPERNMDASPAQLRLFGALVDACARNMAR